MDADVGGHVEILLCGCCGISSRLHGFSEATVLSPSDEEF